MAGEKLYSPKEYWAELANGYDQVGNSGLAPVLHPQAPDWFNCIFDRQQFRGLRRALSIADFSPGSRILDVGCGTGRWLRRYAEFGFSPIGVDRTFGMLSIARALDTNSPLTTGLAHDLPFSDCSFDGVTAITVVQHIPYELQARALKEMVRVLRPGGRMILLELTRGKAPHIFPRQPPDWIREVESHGTSLIECFGQEYFFPDRFFVRLAQRFGPGRRHHKSRDRQSVSDYLEKWSKITRVYWGLRRITVTISDWIEPTLRIWPTSFATHAVFVFRKKI